MKKILIGAIATVFLATGCNCQTEKQQPENNKKVTQSPEKTATGTPVMLTKQLFLDEIMDYEASPNEWDYKGELPGLIDFYADWCRPCKMTSPILEELAQEYAGQIIIYKVDVQRERELASAFGIQSIPTFLYMPKGDKPVISSGIAQTPEATKEMFRQYINEILLNKNTNSDKL
jgi:thioredoxin 1